MFSFTEENYLKAIYKLSRTSKNGVSTTSLARRMNTKASSVTDMVKKLSSKKLVHYKRYQGVELTKSGMETAIYVLRKHRLWESFLVEKLNFKWDEVHEIAEQLEHIRSKELINRLDKFLEYPKYDPHGDPIPDKEGRIYHHKDLSLADLERGGAGIIVGVKDSSASFLQYLEKAKMILGTRVKVLEQFDFDNSMLIQLNGKNEVTVSHQVSKNLYVKKNIN